MGIAQDITERKQTSQQIEKMATHDELTGLPNRYLLQDRIMQMLARYQRSKESGAILLLDLDHFKKSTTHLDIQLVICYLRKWHSDLLPLSA